MSPVEIRNQLDPKYQSEVLDFAYPKLYCKNPNQVKAILLGCDPSNSHSKNLPYVFALESGLPIFRSFISSWNRSLGAINLGFDTVYVQNLCRNYFEHETSKNKIWKEVAKLWIPDLKKELEIFDLSIPVLLSAQVLLEALINDKKEMERARGFYNQKIPIPIKSTNNKLGRPLIPFYRHYVYNIRNWEGYRNSIVECISMGIGH